MNDFFNNILAVLFQWFAEFMVKVYEPRIKPFWQKFGSLVILVVGLLVGLWLGRGPLAVEWVNATPAHLRADYRAYYLAYVANEYNRTPDPARAQKLLGLDLPSSKTIPWVYQASLLGKDLDTAITNEKGYWKLTPDEVLWLQRLRNDLPIIQPAKPAAAKLSWGAILLAVVALFAAVGLLYILAKRFFPSPTTVVSDITSPTEPAGKPATMAEAISAAESGVEQPVMSTTATYVLGDDYFDPSFSIEIGADFLGECGIGVSETIGTGDPKKITAFETWLFDKSDIRTVTAVMASEYAYNDPALNSKLSAKGDIHLLKPGAEIVVETTALRVRARIRELEYAEGNLPAHSFIQRMTLELQATVKAQ